MSDVVYGLGAEHDLPNILALYRHLHPGDAGYRAMAEAIDIAPLAAGQYSEHRGRE